MNDQKHQLSIQEDPFFVYAGTDGAALGHRVAATDQAVEQQELPA